MGGDAVDPDDARWRRLHPAGLVVALARSAKAFIGAIATVAVLALRELSRADRNPGATLLGMPVALVALVAALLAALAVALAPPVVRWLTTRYALGEHGISWRSGLFFRKRRSIAYDRIHAIDSVQPWYLQPLRAVTVTVSAGGATEADITLDAVGEDVQLELERLRAEASCPGGTCDAVAREDDAIAASNTFDNQSPKDTESVEPVRHETADASPDASPATSQASVPSDEPVFRATGRDILLYALSDITFLASALVLWGFWQRIADVLPDWVARRTADSLMGVVTRGALAVALLALFCVVLLLMVSVASAIVRFHGFSVWRRGDDLVVSRGLLTRRVSTIPVSRIQTVTIRSNPLRRMLGLCSVQLGLSVGEADDDASDAANADGRSGADILPVIGTSRLWRVLPRMLPEWGLAATSGLRLARTGRGLTRYYVLIPALTLTAGSVAAALAIGLWTAPWRWTALAVPAVALLWLVSRLMRCHADGFALLPEADGVLPRRIVMTGVAGFTWQTLFTRRSRVQSLTRSAPVLRERLGVERTTMPLFVSNGTSEVTFLALRRRDADRLDAWFAPDAR